MESLSQREPGVAAKLGAQKHDPAGHHRGNSRNGKSQKTLQGEFGELELETPRSERFSDSTLLVV